MKKTLFLSLILIFAAGFFTSCIQPDSVYWEDWKITEGYMILTEENSTERVFVPYSSSIQDKSHPATMYEHSFTKRPYTKFTVQTWDKDKIEYTDETRPSFFYITNKPYLLNGFIFYCDDSNDKLYVINTLYNNEEKQKKLKDHVDKYYSNADYRFLISVEGIAADLKILMDDSSGWD